MLVIKMTFICYALEVDIIKMVMMPFDYVKHAYHLSLSGSHLDAAEGWVIRLRTTARKATVFCCLQYIELRRKFLVSINFQTASYSLPVYQL